MDRKGAYAIGAHVAENHRLARSHFFKATCERLSSVSLSQLFGRVTGRMACALDMIWRGAWKIYAAAA